MSIKNKFFFSKSWRANKRKTAHFDFCSIPHPQIQKNHTQKEYDITNRNTSKTSNYSLLITLTLEYRGFIIIENAQKFLD